MKRVRQERRIRHNEARTEQQWEWAGFDPADIPNADDIEDWMVGGGQNKMPKPKI